MMIRTHPAIRLVRPQWTRAVYKPPYPSVICDGCTNELPLACVKTRSADKSMKRKAVPHRDVQPECGKPPPPGSHARDSTIETDPLKRKKCLLRAPFSSGTERWNYLNRTAFQEGGNSHRILTVWGNSHRIRKFSPEWGKFPYTFGISR